jgi:hypothetical protein
MVISLMPLASLTRTDLIFFIYLYQRYLYPVDPNRSNEYGVSGADEAAAGQSVVWLLSL